MDPSPASDPAIVALALGLVGTAVTALAFAVKALSKRKAPSSRPPPVLVEPPRPPQGPSSSTSQMRAVTEAVMRREREEQLHARVDEMHRIVTAKDAEGEQYRVHNKARVEQAILNSERFDERQVELLEQILEAVSERPPPPGRYRQKLPSVRGGE